MQGSGSTKSWRVCDMDTITEIFRSFGPEYVDRFGNSMPASHHKVIKSILECKTAESGIAIYECKACGKTYQVFRSCGNRHCPKCQHHKTMLWVEKQLERSLPGHHFMITFTVPEQIRSFIRGNQRLSYGAMFSASSKALKKIVADKKYIGGDLPGFFGVLHTWGRQLQFHPHIHFIVPGGAISKHDRRWHPSRVDFYAPVRALSKIYKAKFKDLMVKAGCFHEIPPAVWDIDWNVNSQPVGEGESAIRYLSPYVFKVAISSNRIVKVEGGNVTFRYKKVGSNRPRHMTLDAMEFIRRFLQHVLPAGFMKVRYYGFLHPSSPVTIAEIRTRIEISYGFRIGKIPVAKVKAATPVCPSCGGSVILLAFIPPCGVVCRSG